MLNVLIAYPYLDRKTIEMLQAAGPDLRIIIDSGAFTAWKAGKPIEIDDYCRFLEGLPFTPWRYFMLDVIGDPERTIENLEIMRRRGFAPIPVFTRGEAGSTLDYFFSVSDLVAIGGLVGTRGNKGFVRGIMEHVGERHVHWLGFTNKDFVKTYRPYSCDSSSWASGVRYGVATVYDFAGGFIALKKSDMTSRPSERILELIARHGEDPHLLARAEQWINTGRNDHIVERLSIKAHVAQSLDFERRLGTKVFLALATSWQLDMALESYKFWRSTT